MNGMTFVNTPGYYYSIAYFLAAFLVNRTNKQRDDVKGWKRWIIHIVFFGGIVGFMELTDGVRQMLFIPCMMVSISMLLFYIYLCCDFGLKDAGYYCARAFICGEFAASLCWQIYFYFITIRSGDIKWFGWKWLELLGVYVSVFGVLYFLEMYLKEETEENSVNSRELITVIIITAAVFVVSNISYLDQGTLFSSRFAGEMFTIRTLVDLSGMAVLYAYHIQMRELQMKFEVDTLQNILEMQYKNYQLSQESIEIVNQKYHDLKHQITLLKAEANSEKSTQYLEQMEKEIKSYEAQNKTGNKVLDAVLTSKSLYCQNKGIVFTCVADGTLLDFMDVMDICSIFGNALDNAIECEMKIPDKEKRLIHVTVSRQKAFLILKFENYCEEKLQYQDGNIATTKKDKKYHGYGMKSIRYTVNKYGGAVTIDTKENWFDLKILIPIKEEQGD